MGRAAVARDRVDVLGIPVDRVTMDEAVARVEVFLRDHVRDERSRLVMTPNPEIIHAARHDRELKAALQGADLSLPDGTGVVWASRRLGRPAPGRVTGVDLLDRLLALSADKGYRVFFLGTRPGVLDRAVDSARERYRGLQVAGSHHGYFSPAEEAAVVAAVRAARPDLLFVGMGAPRDQRWLWRHRDVLGVPVAMGVGGSFDVLAGVVPRAPGWVRAANVEWLYRLARQPRRWRRMLVLPRFAWAVWRESLRQE